jgi:hypothetical protein
MNARGASKKSKTESASEKKLENGAEGLSKKELLVVFNLLTAAAKLLEDAPKTQLHIKMRAMRVNTVETKTSETAAESAGTATGKSLMPKTVEAPLPKHLDRAHIAADTWPKRDLLCRRMSAYSYKIAKSFLNKQDYKNAIKWMNLSIKYLRLSMDPKKQITEEKLQELEDMLYEIQKRRKDKEDQH